MGTVLCTKFALLSSLADIASQLYAPEPNINAFSICYTSPKIKSLTFIERVSNFTLPNQLILIPTVAWCVAGDLRPRCQIARQKIKVQNAACDPVSAYHVQL